MPNRPKKKLGLLLSTSPQHSNIETVSRLAEAALAVNDQVYLYLIDEGTRAMEDPRLARLAESGLKLFVCAYGAERHRVALSGPAVPCGLVVLTDLIKGCDRFVAFN